METIWLELVIVLLLILANGFFAGAELAIVSVRRGRIALGVARPIHFLARIGVSL